MLPGKKSIAANSEQFMATVRINLFEFEDFQWFPTTLRNYMTDFLQFLSSNTPLYKPIVPILDDALQRTGSTKILDLCSGGGGGLLWINDHLRKSHPNLKIVLTDFYPNKDAFELTKSKRDNFDYYPGAVDARHVLAELSGFRTQFLSFHHFNVKDATQILQNAVDSGSAIAIFEAQERSLQSFLAMMFSPITLLAVTPFIRPFRLGRIIFTYLFPLVPFFVLWDGIASCLRTYSITEMTEMVAGLRKKDTFEWQIGRKGSILFLVGMPKTKV